MGRIAVSGTWKGTNREKIYEELGLETLDQRRYFRRLVQFYKIMNDLTPDYLKIPIPPLKDHLFGTRSTNILKAIPCRTERYQNSFYPDTVNAWNMIGPELRGIASLSMFKKKNVEYNPTSEKIVFLTFTYWWYKMVIPIKRWIKSA